MRGIEIYPESADPVFFFHFMDHDDHQRGHQRGHQRIHQRGHQRGQQRGHQRGHQDAVRQRGLNEENNESPIRQRGHQRDSARQRGASTRTSTRSRPSEGTLVFGCMGLCVSLCLCTCVALTRFSPSTRGINEDIDEIPPIRRHVGFRVYVIVYVSMSVRLCVCAHVRVAWTGARAWVGWCILHTHACAPCDVFNGCTDLHSAYHWATVSGR